MKKTETAGRLTRLLSAALLLTLLVPLASCSSGGNGEPDDAAPTDEAAAPAVEEEEEAEIEEKRRIQREQMAHQLYTAMLNSNFEAETVIIAAAKRYFNLGSKRMREFLDFVKEVRSEYEEYRRDDVFAHMAEQEFADVGINIIDELYTGDNIRSALLMFEAEAKPSVTKEEAEMLRKNLKGFKNIVQPDGD